MLACRKISALWVVLVMATSALAQSANDTPSLGDLAREYRREHKPENSEIIITNENFSDLVEGDIHLKSQRKAATATAQADQAGHESLTSDPNVTCSFSFSADGAAPPDAGPLVEQNMPDGEVSRLDGPAAIVGDSLNVSVYNPTGWDIREITVGVTIVRHAPNAAQFGGAKLLPAVVGETETSEKRPDVTLLYKLKGSAAPFSSSMFKESLGITLDPDQEWHWAIIQARGIPPGSPLPTSQ
jgi:hypothetical protein